MKLVIVSHDFQDRRDLKIEEVPKVEVLRDGEKFYWFEMEKPGEVWFREVRVGDLSTIVKELSWRERQIAEALVGFREAVEAHLRSDGSGNVPFTFSVEGTSILVRIL